MQEYRIFEGYYDLWLVGIWKTKRKLTNSEIDQYLSLVVMEKMWTGHVINGRSRNHHENVENKAIPVFIGRQSNFGVEEIQTFERIVLRYRLKSKRERGSAREKVEKVGGLSSCGAWEEMAFVVVVNEVEWNGKVQSSSSKGGQEEQIPINKYRNSQYLLAVAHILKNYFSFSLST